MKSLIVILSGFSGSWWLTDISSDNALFSVVGPIGVIAFLIAMLLWLVTRGGMGSKVPGGSTGGFIDSSNFGGDDCGGGGDC
ncbi:MAG: hypothetical protein MI867_16335 [Pseudomonadales bacterium]|nr:hypothetical protein [Pseudomonadales bacterium]